MTKKKKKNLTQIKFEKFLKKSFIPLSIILVLVVMAIALYVNTPENNTKVNMNNSEGVLMEVYYLRTCPHCHEQIKFHDTLEEKFPNLNIEMYEVSTPSGREKLNQLLANDPRVNKSNFGTPTTVIGDQIQIGYGSPDTTGQKLIDMIKEQKASK